MQHSWRLLMYLEHLELGLLATFNREWLKQKMSLANFHKATFILCLFNVDFQWADSGNENDNIQMQLDWGKTGTAEHTHRRQYRGKLENVLDQRRYGLSQGCSERKHSCDHKVSAPSIAHSRGFNEREFTCCVQNGGSLWFRSRLFWFHFSS